MNNFKINKKICHKLIAITLVTTLTYTQIATTTYAQASVNPQVNSVVFQTPDTFKYSIDGKNYTITRKTDGSMTVVEESVNGTNTLTMDNNGNVEITIKDGILPKKERFQITNFDGENLDINTLKLKNNNFKESVSKLENYFDSISLDESNKKNDSSFASREDYNNIQTSFITDLRKNNVNVDSPRQLKAKKGLFSEKAVYASAPVVSSNDLASVGIAVSSGSAFLDGLIIAGGGVASTGILLTTGLLIGAVVLGCVIYNNQMYWIETPPNNLLAEYGETRFNPLTLEDAKNIGLVDVREVVTELTRNLEDNNPDNDFFKAFMVSDGLVVIDFTRPISKEKAAQVLGGMLNVNEHIYTLSPQLADEVVREAGGLPGTSNGKLEYVGRAENHAYIQSYKAFDPITKTVNPSLLVENDKLGVYYWHYHFNGKKMLNGQMNNKHTWFGLPKVKTK